MKMRAKIDREGCIGCGLCASVCPSVFGMAGDGLAEVIGDVTEGIVNDAKEAADSCPVGVITIEG